jgi:NADPH:quinone reductase-like Zn-dependent oxidoreductase
MKASVLHEYGGPKNLNYEDFDDPKAGPGEVLVAVSAISINPVDWKMRSGEAKERFPVEFPGILGRDLSGVVREIGEGVTGVEPGDRVMALTHHTYAELCVVKASEIAHVPEDMDMTTAASLPLVVATGDQLIHRAAKVQPGQTVLITGAVGSVGRIAIYAALKLGATVIAGVRKSQIEEAELLGAVQAVDLDDREAMATIGLVDAVADTVGGKLAPELLSKVKQGGIYGSLLGVPEAAKLHPTI